jgi:uncharacterized protein (TIGR03067 family)
MTFRGNTVTVRTPAKQQGEFVEYKCTCQIDAEKNTIDMSADAGKSKKETSKGIYQLMGNKLKMCLALPGEKRPAKFTIGDESWNILLVLKRVRAPRLNEQGRKNDSESTKPIATRGQAEIGAIEIVRRRDFFAARDADLTYMTLQLWFPATWKGQAFTYLIKLDSLEPVIDDTGKVLLTKTRRATIDALSGEVRYDGTMGHGDKEGPEIRMVVEVPARQATTLKAIKGKATVSRVSSETLRFDLAAVTDKPLRHKMLKDFKIQPRLVTEDGNTSVILRVPPVYGRLVKWEVESDRRPLRSYGEGISPESSGTDLMKMYSGKLPKDCSLVLKLTFPRETKKFDFNFQNVQLP